MTDTHSRGEAGGVTPPVGHEMSDVRVGGVFIFALGLLVTGIIVHLFAWMLFAYFAGREAQRTVRQYPLAASQQDRVPPSPRLQVQPARGSARASSRRGRGAE